MYIIILLFLSANTMINYNPTVIMTERLSLMNVINTNVQSVVTLKPLNSCRICLMLPPGGQNVTDPPCAGPISDWK